MKYKYSYLVSVQYLGFRFHGWQKQKNAMSLHEMVDKTLNFTLEEKKFKSLGSGRTDSKVSVNKYYFQLFVNNEFNIDSFIRDFNLNAPSDLKVTNINMIIDDSFNIIQSPKYKEYHYYFSYGTKNHPYACPIISWF